MNLSILLSKSSNQFVIYYWLLCECFFGRFMKYNIPQCLSQLSVFLFSIEWSTQWFIHTIATTDFLLIIFFFKTQETYNNLCGHCFLPFLCLIQNKGAMFQWNWLTDSIFCAISFRQTSQAGSYIFLNCSDSNCDDFDCFF